MSTLRTRSMHTCALVLRLVCITLTNPQVSQSASLSISPGSSLPGSTVTLPIVLATTGTSPAALQLRMNYASSDIVSVSMVSGPAATSAGKALQCHSSSGATTCIVSGINVGTMNDGVVATATVQLAAA